MLESEQPVDELVALLREEHPLYDRLGSFEILRIRGSLLLALGERGLADLALPYVLEELESAHDPYLTAVAARVLRTTSPRAAFAAPLLDALLYIRQRDDVVRLDAYGGYGSTGESTTATAEVLRTIGWLAEEGRAALPRLRALRDERPGPVTVAAVEDAIAAIEVAPGRSAGCCCSPAEPSLQTEPTHTSLPADLYGVEFEDQDGVRLRFEEFFVGRPAIVVFFYTRCDNPTKCALTISKLGRLRRLLRDEGLDDDVRTAAITYDPAFDLPDRMTQYARSWGAPTGADHRMLRTTDDFSVVKTHFELGVNYGPSLVNRHRLEAYVLGPDGTIAASVTRLRWSERDLIDRAVALRV
ncbi:MAG: SCO family protein [Acidimicrobiales bacterium]